MIPHIVQEYRLRSGINSFWMPVGFKLMEITEACNGFFLNAQHIEPFPDTPSVEVRVLCVATGDRFDPECIKSYLGSLARLHFFLL